MVRKLYESHARPFTRVVHGLPMSWDGSTAATIRPFEIRVTAWSPCDRFIAVTWDDTMKVEILDSVTLQRLQTLETLQAQAISTERSALAFSPDGRMLTCFGPCLSDEELFAVSWDLQTGDVTSAIRWKRKGRTMKSPPITYLANGKTVGVCCRYSRGRNSVDVLDVTSGVRLRSHSLGRSIPRDIWIHGESLRFITINWKKTITIWEVGFTPGAKPTKVETFPTPENPDPVRIEDSDSDALSDDETDEEEEEYPHFHPAPCRLALNFHGKVLVWDVQNSKYLLHCADAQFQQYMSFSSDGRFFACTTDGSGVYVWKESATGDYILHRILAIHSAFSRPLLSHNGGSIITLWDTTIRSWHTKGYTTTPPGISTRAPEGLAEFLLDFSPDGMLAAVARRRDRTVTVLDLKSGVLQLTIHADMWVCGFRVIGNTITVIGDKEFITWELPTGDRVPGAEMTRKDSVRSTLFSASGILWMVSASVSPDSCYFVITTMEPNGRNTLRLYDGSTGEDLAQCAIGRDTPFFAPGGRDLWLVDDDGCGTVIRIGGGEQVQLDPRGRVYIEDPPEGYPLASSCGYRVADNRWILGPDGKRLLMLPPPWQSSTAVRRVWKGQYLALLYHELPEPVILELYQ